MLCTLLVLVARMTLVLVLVTAIATKLRGATAWRGYLDSTVSLVPGPLRRRWVPVALVLGEAAVVVTTSAPGTSRLGAVAGAGLFATMAVVLALAARANTTGSCHCFGESHQPVGTLHVVRNLVLALIALIATALPTGAPGPLLALLAGYAAVVAALLVVFAEELVPLLAPRRAALAVPHPEPGPSRRFA